MKKKVSISFKYFFIDSLFSLNSVNALKKAEKAETFPDFTAAFGDPAFKRFDSKNFRHVLQEIVMRNFYHVLDWCSFIMYHVTGAATRDMNLGILSLSRNKKFWDSAAPDNVFFLPKICFFCMSHRVKIIKAKHGKSYKTKWKIVTRGSA